MLIITIVASISLAKISATAPTATEIPTTNQEVQATPLKTFMPVVDVLGKPLADHARAEALRATIEGFHAPKEWIPEGSNLVIFRYEGPTVVNPNDGSQCHDVLHQLEGRNWHGGMHLDPCSRFGDWQTIVWSKPEEGPCRFSYRRWGCAPISIPMPSVTGSIIDIGELHAVPVATFTQQFRLVDKTGAPVRTKGAVSLRLNGSAIRHPGTINDGVATFEGVFAGMFLLEGYLKGYTFGERNVAFVKAIPDTVVDITVNAVKSIPVATEPAVAAAPSTATTVTATGADAPAVPWLTDFPAAVAKATKAGKPLLLDFTGSDWCGWCKKLHGEVFDTATFATWAQDKVVLVELDFPHRTPQEQALKEQNETLAKRFGIHGYPTIILLDPTGTTVLGKMGYQKGGPGPWTAAADGFITKAEK